MAFRLVGCFITTMTEAFCCSTDDAADGRRVPPTAAGA